MTVVGDALLCNARRWRGRRRRSHGSVRDAFQQQRRVLVEYRQVEQMPSGLVVGAALERGVSNPSCTRRGGGGGGDDDGGGGVADTLAREAARAR